MMRDERAAVVPLIVFFISLIVMGMFISIMNIAWSGAIENQAASMLHNGSSDSTYNFLSIVWLAMPIIVLIALTYYLFVEIQKRKYQEGAF